MLEETLKSINKNLERIANACERTNEPINQLASEENTIINNPINTIAVPVQAQTNISEAVTTAIPVTQTETTFTQEQLAVAMSNAVAGGKMAVIQNILQSFGVQALTQINPNDYNKLAAMLKEQGVEV